MKPILQARSQPAVLQRATARLVLILLAALFIGVSVADAQQNPDGILPLSTTDQPYLFLVRDPVVHKDLKLSDEQQKKLNTINEKVDMSMWSMRNKGPQKLVEIMKESTATTKKSLKTFLTKAQIRRISVIELWVLGMKSLLRDNIAKYLKLESEQSTEIRQILETAQKGMVDLRKELNAGGDAADLNKQFRELQLSQQQDVIAVLTDEQKQSYVKLLGESINTTKLGRIKFKAPEIASNAGWVNSAPLTMAGLEGKVVALHFYAFH